MIETMQTTQQFIEAEGIRFTATYKGRGESESAGRLWVHDKWACVFTREGKRFTTSFKMGRGHEGKPPTAESVLSCLACDCASWEEAEGPYEFACELGYDNAWEARRVYDKVGRQRVRLRAFLGQEAYDRLLWETERE